MDLTEGHGNTGMINSCACQLCAGAPLRSSPALTYNLENFMTAAGSNTYVYDAEGRRVKKTVSGVTTDYFYLGGVVISEKQGTNWTDYVFFGGQRIAKQTGTTASTATYQHTDHLGSARLCTDSSGNLVGNCTYFYEPFGELQAGITCSLATNYRYAGMEWDEEIGGHGFYHTWFRQYDPAQGRWLSVDSLPGSADTPQSLNRYAYVLNDPTNLIDPLGLHECREGCTHVYDEETGLHGCWCPTDPTPNSAMEQICRTNPGSLLCRWNLRSGSYLGNEGLSFKEQLLLDRLQEREWWREFAKAFVTLPPFLVQS